MAKQFADVSSEYGAPMGRPNYCRDDEARVSLSRVNFVDGDYDDGGAYWGGGRGTDPLYCARADDVQLFVRAKSREAAKAEILEDYPDLRFYR